MSQYSVFLPCGVPCPNACLQHTTWVAFEIHKQRLGDGKFGYKVQVTADGCRPPSGYWSWAGPAVYPCFHKRVGNSARGKHSLYTHVVDTGAVGAWLLIWFVMPGSGVVAVTSPGLWAKWPLVSPCPSTNSNSWQLACRESRTSHIQLDCLTGDFKSTLFYPVLQVSRPMWGIRSQSFAE